MVFVLPKSEIAKVPSLPLFLESPMGTELEFIRGVTLVVEVPATELEHVRKWAGDTRKHIHVRVLPGLHPAAPSSFLPYVDSLLWLTPHRRGRKFLCAIQLSTLL